MVLPSYEDYIPNFEHEYPPTDKEARKIEIENIKKREESRRLVKYLENVHKKYPDILSRIVQKYWVPEISIDEFDQIRFWDWARMMPLTGSVLSADGRDFTICKRGCFKVTSHDLTKAVMVALIVNQVVYEVQSS